MPEQYIDKLGTKPDKELAREWYVSRQLVAKWRGQLGIPPYRRSRWTDDRIDRLKALKHRTNLQIAIELGVSEMAVAKAKARFLK